MNYIGDEFTELFFCQGTNSWSFNAQSRSLVYAQDNDDVSYIMSGVGLPIS
jgi:hypothetical protein